MSDFADDDDFFNQPSTSGYTSFSNVGDDAYDQWMNQAHSPTQHWDRDAINAVKNGYFERQNSRTPGDTTGLGYPAPRAFSKDHPYLTDSESIPDTESSAVDKTLSLGAKEGSEVAEDTASSVMGGISGGAAAGLGAATMGLSSLITGLAGPAIQEHYAEKFTNFKYGLSKQQASDTGMPLANVLGFGASAPSSHIYNGGSLTTTRGQGISLPQFKGTSSQVLNGYVDY